VSMGFPENGAKRAALAVEQAQRQRSGESTGHLIEAPCLPFTSHCFSMLTPTVCAPITRRYVPCWGTATGSAAITSDELVPRAVQWLMAPARTSCMHINMHASRPWPASLFPLSTAMTPAITDGSRASRSLQ
jgi:hypothetical protein